MQEIENFFATYILKLTMDTVDMDGIWHAVETCWFDESHTYFISSDQYSRERIQMSLFHKKKTPNFIIGLLSDIYRWISFKYGVTIDTTKLYSLIAVWMTLTFN